VVSRDNTKAETILTAAVGTREARAIRTAAAQSRVDGVRSLEWGEMMLTVPTKVVAALELLYPDFTAPDAATRSKAWRWFANSDFGKQFRTQDIRRKY